MTGGYVRCRANSAGKNLGVRVRHRVEAEATSRAEVESIMNDVMNCLSLLDDTIYLVDIMSAVGVGI